MITRVELVRKDKEKFRSARKIPPSGKRPLVTSTLQIVFASLNNASNCKTNNRFVKPSKFPMTYIVFSNHKLFLSVKIHKMFDLLLRDSS